MEVSIIIVNYRVKYFLEQTLLSAKEALGEGLLGEIIVVDNNSEDDSIKFLKEKFSDVEFIENEENVGFARANNLGIGKAKGDFILILNPDTIIGSTTIMDCIKWMKLHPRCGSIGVKMLDGNGNFLPESKRSFPTPWVSFCKIFGLSKLFPLSPRFAKYHLRYLSKNEPHKVDILSGAFMFMRSDVVKGVGGFDKDFFMYGEDIDLSYRVVKSGYDNYYLPTTIIHYKGESTKKNSMRYVRVFYDAMLIFFRKHYPHYSGVYAIFVKAGILMRASVAAIRRCLTKVLGGVCNSKSSSTVWAIVSQLPKDVEDALMCEAGDDIVNVSIEQLQDVIDKNRNIDVVFDNRDFTYRQLIDNIERFAGKNVHFHIYSAQNKLIISPKSNLQ